VEDPLSPEGTPLKRPCPYNGYSALPEYCKLKVSKNKSGSVLPGCVLTNLLSTLVVRVEQSVRCVLCMQTVTFELWVTFSINVYCLSCWFTVTLSRSVLNVKVIGERSGLQDKNCY